MSVAPAKLTLSLRVTGVREDGFHLLDAEMVSIDLVDTLTFEPGSGISVEDEVAAGSVSVGVPVGPDNLVARALAAVGRERRGPDREAHPRRERASAVARPMRLRSCAGRSAATSPSPSGSEPMSHSACVADGHASPAWGSASSPCPSRTEAFVLLLPPLSVDTGAVYKQWDERRARRRR